MAGRLLPIRLLAGLFASAAALALAPAIADAAPSRPVIREPSGIGTIVNAEDVHMEAYEYSDSTPGAVHRCTMWWIKEDFGAGNTAWASGASTPGEPGTPVSGNPECIGDDPGEAVFKNHVHFGDGRFVGPYAGRTSLNPNQDYRLFARFVNDEIPPEPSVDDGEQPFRTASPADVGTGRTIPWIPTEPNYAVEVVAGGLQLPFDVAIAPTAGGAGSSALAYVAGLYGTIYAIRNDGGVSVFANNILDYASSGVFPGGGEFGLGGLAVQPGTGDLYVSTVYYNENADGGNGAFLGKLLRYDTSPGALSPTGLPSSQCTGPTGSCVVLEVGVVPPEEEQGASHQISDVSFGPDGNVYLHQGDGFVNPSTETQNINRWYGKILRINPVNGQPVCNVAGGNPHCNTANGIQAVDYVYARGFRNPFGGAWRAADGRLYEVENGPSVDRFAMVNPPSSGTSQNFGWDGTEASMQTGALYNWPEAVAPVNLAFVQGASFGGSGFPAGKQDHAFVAESGPTYATGRQTLGKRISEFGKTAGGAITGPPSTFLAYDGIGKASAVGIAAGPDGLYFSELYQDLGYTTPIDPGARVLRVGYFAPTQACSISGRTLSVQFDPAQVLGKKKKKGKKGKKGKKNRAASAPASQIEIARVGRRIQVNGRWCGGTVDNLERIAVTGGGGAQELLLDLGSGGFGPGATSESSGSPEVELVVDLGGNRGDSITIKGGDGSELIEITGEGIDLNGDGDYDDVQLAGVRSFTVKAGGGDDTVLGSDLGDLIAGQDGRDRLFGRGGADKLRGGKGRDKLKGGPGEDACDASERERARSCED